MGHTDVINFESLPKISTQYIHFLNHEAAKNKPSNWSPDTLVDKLKYGKF